MRKKRAEWNVHLVRSNLNPIKGKLTPKIRLNCPYSLEEVIERLTGNRSCDLSADILRHAGPLVVGDLQDKEESSTFVTPSK